MSGLWKSLFHGIHKIATHYGKTAGKGHCYYLPKTAVSFLAALLIYSAPPAYSANLAVDSAHMLRPVETIGVHINVKDWSNEQLSQSLDFLATTNGSILLNVVREPMAWVNTADLIPALHALDLAALQAVYETPEMQDLWKAIGYLNGKGVFGRQIILSFTGWAPVWIGGGGAPGTDNRITAGREREFAVMTASLVYYAKKIKGLDFVYLSPLSEVAWNCLDGPCLEAQQYAMFMDELAGELKQMGINDMRLVGPDMALSGKDSRVRNPECTSRESSSAAEWTLATQTADKVLADISNGLPALMFLEAGDNSLAAGSNENACAMFAFDQTTGIYSPRKRAYAYAHFSRFVSPGDVLIGSSEMNDGVQSLAILNAAGNRLTIIGRNSGNSAVTLNGRLANLPGVDALALYETSSSASLQRKIDVPVGSGQFEARISADTIFTLTGQVTAAVAKPQVAALLQSAAEPAAAALAQPAVALVQKAATTSSSARSLSLVFPAPLTAGNLVVVAVSGWPNLPAAVPVTDSLGNSYTIAGNVLVVQGAYSAIYFAKNVRGGAATVTFTSVASSGQISMAVAEFAGIDPVTPLDVFAGATGSGIQPSSGSMVPTMAGDLVIGAGTHNGNTTTAAGSGFTMIAVATEDSVSHQPLSFEYQVLSAAQATAATFSLASGFAWTQNGVMFKPAAQLLPDTSPPSVPSGLSATPVSAAQITLSWQPSIDPVEPGQTVSGVAGYLVFRNGTQIATSTATSYSDSGLQTATSYSYSVVAYDNADNLSAQSAAIIATTSALDTSPPTVPANVTVTGATSSQINLVWSASSDNVAVTGYQVFRNGSQVGTSTSPAFADSGLTPGATYSYTITAFDGSGNVSAQSQPVSAATTSYAFDDEFSGSLLDTTTWVAMNRPGDASNAEAEYYLPENVTLQNGLLTITSKEDSSMPGFNYTSGMVQWKSFNFTYGTIEVRAKLTGPSNTWPAIWLLGANCQQTNIDTADNIPPCNWPSAGSDEIDIAEVFYQDTTHVTQAVHSVNTDFCIATTTDVGQNWHTYSLVWAPGSLTWKIDGVTTCNITANVPTTPMFLIINTAMSANNQISVLPQTSAVDYVRVTTGAMIDTTPPTIPAGLSASAVSSTQINLYWSASSDNTAVAGYRVYRNGSQIATANGTTYSNTMLSPATTYTYTVAAYDAAGNSSGQSLPASATTPASDTIPPAVSITAPASGATVAAALTVSASASDNVGVTNVDFYLDAVLQATDMSSPYTWNWNTATVANGSHEIAAIAYDRAGNSTRTAISILVNNFVDSIAPTVSVTTPANNATISGTVAVTANASDNVWVSRVEFYVNGVLQATDATSPYSFSWNTVALANGSYTLIARAYDTAGNVGGSAATSVTVANSATGIAFVQRASSTTSSAQNLAATFPSGVSAGNLIVVSVSGWPNLPATTAVTDSLGNSYSRAGNLLISQGAYSAIYYTINGRGGANTITFRTVRSGGQISMAVAEFSGVAAISPLDRSAGGTGTGTVPSSGYMTPSQAGELLIGSGTHNGNTTTTPGPGFTMIAVPTEDSQNHQPLAMEYRLLSDTQPAAATFSLAAGFGWTQNGALFKRK